LLIIEWGPATFATRSVQGPLRHLADLEPHHESAPTQPQTGRSPQAPRQRAHVVRDAIQDHELDRPRQCASLLVVGQLNDLTAVDTEDHLPPPGNVTTNFNSSPGGCTSLIIISPLISAISPLRSPPKKLNPSTYRVANRY